MEKQAKAKRKRNSPHNAEGAEQQVELYLNMGFAIADIASEKSQEDSDLRNSIKFRLFIL